MSFLTITTRGCAESLLSFIKTNIKYVGSISVKIAGFLFSLLTLLLTFLTWDDLGVSEKCDRLLILVAILGLAIILAIILLVVKNSNIIWEQGARRIKAIYGDIIKIAFPKKGKGERIVVIPVNTCFDTIIGEGVVSAKTIHGKWIKEMNKGGTDTTKLDEIIEQNIHEQGLHSCGTHSRSEKPKGKLVRFAQGSVLSIEGDKGLTYYLLALSEFDENLNAQCSKETFVSCIQSLITFYSKNGQGNSIYLPLMGTGLSRVNISQEESLNIIVNMLKLNRDKIYGEVNIVVFRKDKNLVSIHNV